MMDKITIGVDCNGEWVESNNHYIWRWKNKEMIETIAMVADRDVRYKDFAKKIISYCELNCELEDLVITYMHSCGEKQRAALFRIKNQISLRTYLEDESRPILRVFMVEKLTENCQNQQILNDECDFADMDILDKESVGAHNILTSTPTLEVVSNTLETETTQSSQSSHAQDK